jgi:hypothetical protein
VDPALPVDPPEPVLPPVPVAGGTVKEQRKPSQVAPSARHLQLAFCATPLESAHQPSLPDDPSAP